MQAQHRGSWLLRHWRGELSLAQSFWLSQLLTAGTLTGLGVAIQSVPGENLRLSALLGVLLFCLIVAAAIWQSVGVWRSATRAIGVRRAQRRRAIWAHAARVLTAIGWLTLAVRVPVVIAPIAWTELQLVAGIDRLGAHQVTLRSDGRAIEVGGIISLGTTRAVRSLLDADPAVRTVDLTSLGGRVIEARALRDLIRARGLATYVGRYCASACTIAFLGGNPRILHDGAKLGFHHYFASGLFSRVVPVEDIYARRDFAQLGVPAAFVAHVFATPSSRLWVPTTSDLLAANVVTEVSPAR